jgi:glucuronokinase
MDTAEGIAHARAALAGNPSDGYGGAVLAFTFAELRATATATIARSSSIEPDVPLVAATVTRFARDFEPAAAATAIHWQTEIPRGVGLGGSSAVVIATARALCDLFALELDPITLAEFALAVETEDLRIAAGLQDRLAQAHGGLLFMDFATGRHEQLPHDALPPMLIAWRPDTAKDSGAVHAPLRDRFERGEPVVVEAMTELARHAHEARAALVSVDAAQLARCVDGSFDARRRILALDPRHVDMVECARACGASANYTGSGGAIVCLCGDERRRGTAKTALENLGADTLIPTVELPTARR